MKLEINGRLVVASPGETGLVTTGTRVARGRALDAANRGAGLIEPVRLAIILFLCNSISE